jgi:polyribonucleotide nucleotidyltransferase
MGWSIKTNNKDKWSLYSSVSESIIATFKTQKELVNFIYTDQIYEGKKKAIETLMTFPSGWTVNNSRMFECDTKCFEDYSNWLKTVIRSKTYEEYYKAIDDKLNELINIR